tara:strand:+ start:202 stop:456 length:255 start_codon:yes stop_codon:yes gene_type:complete
MITTSLSARELSDQGYNPVFEDHTYSEGHARYLAEGLVKLDNEHEYVVAQTGVLTVGFWKFKLNLPRFAVLNRIRDGGENDSNN